VAASVVAFVALQPQAAAAGGARTRATVHYQQVNGRRRQRHPDCPATGSLIAAQQSNLPFSRPNGVVKQILVEQARR